MDCQWSEKFSSGHRITSIRAVNVYLHMEVTESDSRQLLLIQLQDITCSALMRYICENWVLMWYLYTNSFQCVCKRLIVRKDVHLITSLSQLIFPMTPCSGRRGWRPGSSLSLPSLSLDWMENVYIFISGSRWGCECAWFHFCVFFCFYMLKYNAVALP